MKRIYFFPFSFLLLSLLISCKKELVPQESFVDYSKEKNTTNNPTPAYLTDSNLNVSQTKSNPSLNENPPHGQPGHICENGTPQTNPTQTLPNSTQQYTINQPPSSKTTTQTITKVAKGMNPPHGQPGHRCDIAVGLPLNSKPNPTSNTTTSKTTVSNNAVPALLSTTNQTNQTNTTTVKTEPGMNPPHGQEGHVCGIAVGAPLNQDKKTEEKKEESSK